MKRKRENVSLCKGEKKRTREKLEREKNYRKKTWCGLFSGDLTKNES